MPHTPITDPAATPLRLGRSVPEAIWTLHQRLVPALARFPQRYTCYQQPFHVFDASSPLQRVFRDEVSHGAAT